MNEHSHRRARGRSRLRAARRPLRDEERRPRRSDDGSGTLDRRIDRVASDDEALNRGMGRGGRGIAGDERRDVRRRRMQRAHGPRRRAAVTWRALPQATFEIHAVGLGFGYGWAIVDNPAPVNADGSTAIARGSIIAANAGPRARRSGRRDHVRPELRRRTMDRADRGEDGERRRRRRARVVRDRGEGIVHAVRGGIARAPAME